MSTIKEIAGDFDALDDAIRRFREYTEGVESTPHRPDHDCPGLICDFCDSEEIWAMARSAARDIARAADDASQRIGMFAAEEWS